MKDLTYNPETGRVDGEMPTPESHWPHIAARLAETEGLSPSERRKAVAAVLLHEFDLSERVVDTALSGLSEGIEKAGPRGILMALAVAALHLFKSE